MRLAIVLFASFALAGCSLVVDGRIKSKVTDCASAPDGTLCEGGDYCIAGQCRFSFCGDGIANPDRGEECDDGNALAGDGCEPSTCTHSCDEDAPCTDDGNACNGPETCIAWTHVCESGPEASEDAPCERPSGEAGVCSQGFCVPPGCGDGVVVAPEECDPPDGGGCRLDCQWACSNEADCPEADPCTNDRVCDLAQHECVDVGPRSCADDDPCTADSCHAASGCENTPMDEDGDFYAPVETACAAGSPLMAGDCDDDATEVHPGAPEQCNGVDDNCVGGADEDVVEIVCHPDGDGDGSPKQLGGVVTCVCPDGYLPAPESGVFDCNDNDARVAPGQLEWFDTPSCADGLSPIPVDVSIGAWTCANGDTAKWDFNCDGVAEPSNPRDLATTCAFAPCEGSGWSGGVPACGATGTLAQCIADGSDYCWYPDFTSSIAKQLCR